MKNWPFKLKTTYSFGITYDADTRNGDGDDDNDDDEHAIVSESGQKIYY